MSGNKQLCTASHCSSSGEAFDLAALSGDFFGLFAPPDFISDTAASIAIGSFCSHKRTDSNILSVSEGYHVDTSHRVAATHLGSIH